VRLHLGGAREGVADPRGRVEIYPEWRDIWVGVYVSPDAVYVCLVPFLVIRVSRGGKW
jgi:hypothetical protein